MTRLRLLLLTAALFLIPACASDPPPIPDGRSVANNTAPWLRDRAPPAETPDSSDAPTAPTRPTMGTDLSKRGQPRSAPSMRELEARERAEAAADGKTEHATASFVIRLKGMNCPIRCPKDVRQQLEAVPGVISASVDYPSKTASCMVVDGVDPDVVVAALRPPYSGTLAN